VLSDDEVRRLLDACGHDGLTSLRNRALIAILYRAGLRIAKPSPSNPRTSTSTTGASGSSAPRAARTAPAASIPHAAGIVQAWIDARQKWSPNEGHTHGRAVRSPAFCTRDGTALSTAYVRRLLPALARLANIPKRVHAHGLRHTHAAQLREEGLDVGIISKQLGHRSILTTIRYLDHVAPVAVVASVRKRAWLP
jgi:integrase/recombinase XerC